MVVVDAITCGRQRRAITLVDADEELLGDETMHLGHALAVRGDAEGDDMGESVVIINARSLPEMGSGVNSNRVEMERVDKDTADVPAGPGVPDVEVEPKERTPRRRLFDRLRSGADRLAFSQEAALHGNRLFSFGFRRLMGAGRQRSRRRDR